MSKWITSLLEPSAPARRIWGRRRLKTLTGRLSSTKGGGQVEAESHGELRLAIAMNGDRAIRAYRHQPETFSWEDGTGRRRRYTPDFLVQYADGSLAYREVKTVRTFRSNPTLDGRLEYILAICRSREARFEVWVGCRATQRGDGTMMQIFKEFE